MHILSCSTIYIFSLEKEISSFQKKYCLNYQFSLVALFQSKNIFIVVSSHYKLGAVSASPSCLVTLHFFQIRHFLVFSNYCIYQIFKYHFQIFSICWMIFCILCCLDLTKITNMNIKHIGVKNSRITIGINKSQCRDRGCFKR